MARAELLHNFLLISYASEHHVLHKVCMQELFVVPAAADSQSELTA